MCWQGESMSFATKAVLMKKSKFMIHRQWQIITKHFVHFLFYLQAF